MVGTLLGLPEPPDSDHAADALAVAICHGGGGGRRAAEAVAEARERVAG
jgi:Holliday junction resolvasome RuvABC endonuclease subunit